MGIGAIPAAVGRALRDKHDLGVHTEMFTDAVVDLVEAGVVTGRAQGAQPGQDRGHVHDGHAARCTTSSTTTRWSRCGRSTSRTTPHVIRSFSRMTAINSAIEVDLTGQVCADSIGHRMYSGVGGQMDFIRGAALAPRGPGDHRPAVDGRPAGRSRGSCRPSREGAGVVTTRAHVRTIVTEWGVAELYGQSLRERARRLIAIAHPDFRDELTAAARRLHEL